jgi:hypothetical protein
MPLLNEDYARILIKRSILSGTTPTIPVDEPVVANDFDSLLPTDLLVGEMYMNVWDDRMWIRTLNGIIEIPVSGFSSSNYFTTGATLFNDTLYFDRNDQLSAYTVDLSSLSVSGSTIEYWTSGQTGTNSIRTNTTGTTSTGNYSIATGSGNTASGDYSFVGGQSSSVTGSNSFVYGLNNEADANYQFVFGLGNTATTISQNGYIFGSGNYINEADIICFGASNIITAPSAKAFGANLSISGTHAVAFGKDNVVSGIGSIGAGGEDNIVSGNYSFATNQRNEVTGDWSAVFGENSKATANYTYVFGNSITGSTANTTYVDKLNIKTVNAGTAVNNLGVDANGNVIIGNAISGGTGNYLPLSGGTITGDLEIQGNLNICISGATTTIQTDCSGNQILTGVTNSSIVAGSGNTINANLDNVFIAGVNLTGTTSNTAYFSKLNINEVLTGTSVNNLGIDSNGFVVVGSTGSTQDLQSVLSIGNETFGNDIILTSGDTIQAGSGAGILNLRDGFDDFVTLGNVFKRIEFTTNQVNLIHSAQNGLKITNTDFVIKNEAAGVIKMTSQSGSTFGEIQIVNSSSVNTTEDTPHFPVFISTQDAFIDGGVENSAVIGGVGLSALTSDTVYVPDLDVAGDLYGSPYDLSFAVSDEVTQITTGTSVTTLFTPRTFTVSQVKFSLSNSGSTTSTIDVLKNGSTILAAPLSLGSGALITGVTISPNQFVESDKITVDIDAAGTGAAGAKVYLKGKTSRVII